jgi:hypothetical protein
LAGLQPRSFLRPLEQAPERDIPEESAQQQALAVAGDCAIPAC